MAFTTRVLPSTGLDSGQPCSLSAGRAARGRTRGAQPRPTLLRVQASTEPSTMFSQDLIAQSRRGVKGYWCDICQISLSKEKQFKAHIEGKKHLANKGISERIRQEYIDSAPAWAGEEVGSEEYVLASWSNSELKDFPRHGKGLRRFKEGQNLIKRALEAAAKDGSGSDTQQPNVERPGHAPNSAQCLSPSTMVSDLTAYQKARLWRYLREVMDPGRSNRKNVCPELADIIVEAATQNPKLVRIKEVFESMETYRAAENFLIACLPHHKIEKIVDMACGHGLVGLMLAYRFPQRTVVCSDIARREAFQNYVEAFNSKGTRANVATGRPADAATSVMANVEFVEGDIREIEQRIDRNTCVMVIHGCNEVCIEMAQEKGAPWMAMPCCINTELYLPGCLVGLGDELENNSRYNAMCGALAHKYRAQWMVDIDRSITNRNIMIAGGCEMAEGRTRLK